MKKALIIFVRNPQAGKVKTRLAATIGDEKALLLYKHLLQHTHDISLNLPVTKFVYYADYVNNYDLWSGFEKRLQQGNDLGERMKNAFAELFKSGFTNICIIGSDCYELTSEILTDAFEKLNTADVVAGPVSDGGYYILGMNKPVPDFFINKEWSTDTVFSDTLKDAAALNLTMHQLPMLHDIDTETDLRNSALAFFV
jgi:rSAM/selenodomain-associated transferase 1